MKVKVSSTVSTAALSRIVRRLANPRPVLEELGQALKTGTQERIKTTKTSPDGTPFAPWSIATALARQKRGTVSGGILFDTGKLFNSIQYQVTGKQVEVGADESAPYAKYLQAGTRNMPARPFVGISERDLENVRKILRSYIQKA